mmetsp:Transcript_5108/g.6424  ORF Transcript_5108/g.6424 Transcript_5108/m.6424 type:complete len:314 (+) Transcript_5108:165-1106(+)
MKIEEHQIIRKEVFQDLLKFFTAIDTNLNLHYSNHTIDPSLNKILDSAARLIGRRITNKDLLCILQIYPDAYVIKHNNKINDHSEYLLTLPENIPLNTFNQCIPFRKEKLLNNINTWIDRNRNASEIMHPPIEQLVKKQKHTSTSRIQKPPSNSSSPTKISKSDLMNGMKNDSSKFIFRSKDENYEKKKNNGLSLLERIRLKEKLKNEQKMKDTPEMKYHTYIQSKLVPVYDILFHIHRSQDKQQYKSYPLSKLVSIIEDSLDYPTSQDEIKDTVYLLEKKLGTGKIEILSRGGVTAIKVIKLDRDIDMKALK